VNLVPSRNCIFQSFLFLLSLNSFAQNTEHGFIDLSYKNFKKEVKIDLSGQWEFYWNKLLTPTDFENKQTFEWIHVPGAWQRQNYSALGYATYRVHLKLPPLQNSLSLYFPVINSASKIWVNKILVVETGKVSSNVETHIPKLSATLLSIPDNTSDIEIIVQVSNFNYFSGGISGEPLLASTAVLFSQMNKANGVQNFFAGSLIALFIYQLILYFVYQRGKPYLWLSLVCLGVALRALIVHGGSFLLPDLFPFIGWEIWKKLEFGSVYAIVALFPLYVYHLFPESSSRKPIIFFVTLASVLCTVVIVTPQYIYGKLLEVSHLGLLLGFIYAVFSISKAWRGGNKDAKVILFGVLASFPFILTEILKNSLLYPLNIQFMYLVELGVLVFLLFQVYLLASHYAASYNNLELLNQDLERKVTERTEQLVTANTVKDRLLSVMSHDIKSPLNSLRGILQVYNKGAVSMEEFNHFTKLVENDLSKTTMLVENILFWTASQLKGVQVAKEKFNLNLLINETIQLFETIAANKKILIKHNITDPLIIDFDRNILNLVLRNLISNAVKFSHEGGIIQVDVKPSMESVLIRIKDQGIGMDDLTIQTLLDPKKTVSTAGTIQEKGTGLGLSLCRDYLQKSGGLLTVESKKGIGSTFNVVIPTKLFTK
jgi:two-component system sensor histidine kinase ChiS